MMQKHKKLSLISVTLLLGIVFLYYYYSNSAAPQIYALHANANTPTRLTVDVDGRTYSLPIYFLEGWKGQVHPGQTRYYSGWISRRYFTLGFIDGEANNPWSPAQNNIHWKQDPDLRTTKYIEPVINVELELIAELDDAMKAVYTADQRLVAVELGCACGPQLGTIAAINKRSRNLPMKLIGVEAEPKKLEMFHLNMRDNNVANSEYKLIHGAISIDNTAINFTFNRGDGASDYGSHVVTSKLSDILVQGERKVFVEVPSFTVCDIVREEAYIDYLHMDIQGMELHVLRKHIHCLNEKVRIMHIGIHGYAIYAAAIEILLNNGWILKYFSPGVTANPMPIKVFPTKFGERYSQDGLISVVNTRFSNFRLFSVLLQN